MSITNPIDFKEQFSALHQDAVLWKAHRLWKDASDPDEQAAAMEQLTAMLLCINNDTKRSAYIKQVCDANNKSVEDRKENFASLQKEHAQKQKTVAKLESKKKLNVDETFMLQQCKEDAAWLHDDLQKLAAIKTALLPEKDLRKAVNDAIKKRTNEALKKQMNAAFEKKIASAEDAGMPEDFKGSMQDVFDAIKYGIYVHDDVYYSRGGNKGDYPISNFTMKILYHVDTSDEQAFRLIAVKNVYGFEVVINLNTDDFVALGSFKKVLARRGDFVFKGTDSDLTRLQEYLQKDEVKTVYVKTLGYHPRGSFWAWGNGIMPLETNAEGKLDFIPVDEYGIVHYLEKNYFIPACSKMFIEKDDLFVNEKKFIYTKPIANFSFNEWSELLHKTYGKKSIIAILFYIGSLYRDITMKQVQRYPLLNLFGPPGAGKGQMAESIMAMFGERQDQIMLGGASTVVGFMRKFAQFRNAIVWLDEYKNNLPVKFIESFKNIYDGKGYERGKMTNDFTTESTPIHSSCILSGQDMPTQEPALFMRTIMLAFEEGKFTDDQRESFQKLKRDYESHGLSYITADLFKHRKIIQEKFTEKFQLIFKQTVKDVANVEVDDRMIMNISMLLTYMHLLNDVLHFPFTYNSAKAFLIDNMMHQHAILAGNNDVSKFWGVVESMFYMDIIHDERDFKLEDGKIYLRLQQVHPLYVKELKNRGDLNYLSKSTLEHYLQLDNTVYIGHERKRFSDGSNTHCYVFRYSKLGIDLIKIKNTGMSIAQADEELNRKYKEMGVVEAVTEDKFSDSPF